MLFMAWIGMIGFFIFGTLAMTGLPGAAPVALIMMVFWIGMGLLEIGRRKRDTNGQSTPD